MFCELGNRKDMTIQAEFNGEVSPLRTKLKCEILNKLFIVKNMRHASFDKKLYRFTLHKECSDLNRLIK